MSPASTFATRFARLVSLRAHEPTNIDAHRAALADVVAANEDAVTLTWDNWRLRSDGDVIRVASNEMAELLSRMAAHGVRELSFGAGTERAHVAAVAWILCQQPMLGDGGASAVSRLSTLGATGVDLVPVTAPLVEGPSTPTATDRSLFLDLEPRPRRERVFLTARRSETRETAEVLIAQLTEARTLNQITRALDALAAFTELPKRRIADVAAILTAMLDEQPRFTHDETKRLFARALARIAKPGTFRAMAASLASGPEKRGEYVRIFKYFGDPAADQVIEELAHADSRKERRILYDILVELQHGVPTLIYLLGDGRWYVARNAAELLGEMHATEAEQGLAWLLSHPDARVRRSASAALAKLDTPGARTALEQATKDTSPDVRMNALLALSNGDTRRVVTQILRALPDERDPDAQRTLMLILARLGTPEAIQYLRNAAEPEKGFFKKRTTPKRLAAISALADAADPEALETIRAMAKDKEPEVRDAAERALTPARALADW
jgi:HEAT repeat protein